MYISRAEFRRDASKSPSFWRNGAGEYDTHRHVWRLFAGEQHAARDFLYRQEEQRGAVRFLMVSAREPKDVDGLWQIETKTYAPRLRAGQQLAFCLRANAVRTRQDAYGKRHRHDVVMEAKRSLRDAAFKSEDGPSLPELVQREGFVWLATRALRCGFAITETSVRVDGYRQHHIPKPRTRSPIRFSSLEYNGLLEVRDPVVLLEALCHGIGPSKGFGCGLLLVRPA